LSGLGGEESAVHMVIYYVEWCIPVAPMLEYVRRRLLV
jgi:hypothetical protein